VAGVGRRGIVVALLAILAGCGSGPPVQEMSDARQAIAVAKEAGAEDHAAEALRDAEALLESAQRNLSDRAYNEARRDALRAKLKALDALAIAENSEQEEQP
jgi:hypothetical protein